MAVKKVDNCCLVLFKIYGASAV